MSGTADRLKIEVPKSLRVRPKDARGYPIPFIVFNAKDGTPVFTINDHKRVQEAVNKKLCGLCGSRMREGFWFVGGRRCFTDPRGAFLDPPMHKDCALYAVRVCPFLAAPRYSNRIDDKNLKADNVPDGFAIVDHDAAQPDERPDIFGVGRTPAYSVDRMAMSDVFVPQGWDEIQYWRHGQRMHDGGYIQNDGEYTT